MNPKSDTKPQSKWIWALGIALLYLILFVPPSLFRSLMSYVDSEITRYRYIWYVPMMYGSGMMRFGMMFLTWLIMVGLLVLLALAIASLVKKLASAK